MRKTKEAIDSLKSKVLDRIEEERATTLTTISQKIEALCNKEEYKKLSAPQQEDLLEPFHSIKKNVADQPFIANIRLSKLKAEDLYTEQLNKMVAFGAPTKDKASEPPQQYIKSSNLRLVFDKDELRTEDDVEEYIEAIRTAYLEQIRKNRKITLN